MGRYRNIHCMIWNDDKFPFCSDDAQLVFFHLMTTPMSTPFGLYKASLEALAAEKRWPLKRYRESFRECSARHFCAYDEKTLVVFLPSFLKYNPPHNLNTMKSWKTAYSEIPDCECKHLFWKQLKTYAESLGESYALSFRECFPEHSLIRPSPAPVVLSSSSSLLEKNKTNSSNTTREEKSDDKDEGETPEDIKLAWNLMAGRCGLAKVRDLTPKRKTHLKERLKSTVFLENYSKALKQIPSKPFLLGKVDGHPWRADFDWFIRNDDSAVKVVEGKYDQ